MYMQIKKQSHQACVKEVYTTVYRDILVTISFLPHLPTFSVGQFKIGQKSLHL